MKHKCGTTKKARIEQTSQWTWNVSKDGEGIGTIEDRGDRGFLIKHGDRYVGPDGELLINSHGSLTFISRKDARDYLEWWHPRRNLLELPAEEAHKLLVEDGYERSWYGGRPVA